MGKDSGFSIIRVQTMPSTMRANFDAWGACWKASTFCAGCGAKRGAAGMSISITCQKRTTPMAIPNETLQAMIQSFNGFALTDEELERLRPELDNYIREMEKLRELNLADVMSSRLIRAQEGEAI